MKSYKSVKIHQQKKSKNIIINLQKHIILTKKIEFKNLSFSYNENKYVLKNINLSFVVPHHFRKNIMKTLLKKNSKAE